MRGFEIVRSVGRGVTAEVFEARDADGRPVALKIFPAGFRAFQWHAYVESELLSKLDHPAILKVLRFGEEEGRPFLVMEFIDGPSLERRVLGQGPLFQEDAVRMIRRIAEGLLHAHAAGVFHGDLRPRNVLLRGGDPLQPILCDFGLTAQGSQSGDLAALAELLRFAAGPHPLAERLGIGNAESALKEIDRFLAGDPMTRILPRRRGCLG